jgi:acyl dehydratase
MAVRGVYTKEEEAMLAEWKERTDKMVGWLGDPNNRVATVLKEWSKTAGKLAGQLGVLSVANREVTASDIKRYANVADFWNPLYHDQDYAEGTRWGGIIAPPFILYHIVSGGPYFMLTVPPEMGITKQWAFGDQWSLSNPVRAGDTFRVWIGRPDLEDLTDLDGKSPRVFKIRGNMYYINQRDEVAGIFHRYNYYMIIPPGTDEKEYVSGAEWDFFYLDNLQFPKDEVYTDEDIAAIARIGENEIRRGATPRYWEDVQVGDELTPIIQGPLTIQDNIAVMSTGTFPPMREMIKTSSHRLLDPDTNIEHSGAEWHLTEKAVVIFGQYSNTIFVGLISAFFGRLTTNWMGDDGLLLKQNHRKFHNVPYTDTIIGKGKVVKKYIDENGDHLVDLDLWMESSRGCIADVSLSTVKLLSREQTLAWKG